MSSRVHLLLVYQAFVGLLTTSATQAGNDRKLLDFTCDAHRVARESIQTFTCGVEFTITITPKTKPPITQSCSSRYWLSTKKMRAKTSEHKANTDYLWNDSVRQYVECRETEGQPTAAAVRTRYTHRHEERCDPFVRGLLVLNHPNTLDFLPFEELVERASKLKKAERKRVGSKELIVVQLSFDAPKESKYPLPAWTVDIYFDPTVNYLVRQVVYTEPKYRRKEEVLEFKEYQPGFFFPEQVIGSAQRLPSEAKDCDQKTRFSDVRINQPLPQDIFNFKYPHGVYLSDNIRGCVYQVDADGNQISQETSFGREPPPPIKDGDAQAFGAETQEEPLPWSRWILPISLGILIAGGVAAFLRRRRRLADSA